MAEKSLSESSDARSTREEVCPLVTVTITAESADWLAGFARSLVADRLAACGNIMPGIRSIYAWDGAIQDDAEALLLIHTRASSVGEIIRRADAEHPYDTPQVLAVPIVEAHEGYREWVVDQTD
ncbi:divalent-cation tolerance protein CutA [Nocardia sp. NPDC127606]|uniref:divalent-cation tolerance protein CutA n=1 Tax=Nocardia sp. NPDC127606 TaxID=3345406 RepID=UPI0036415D3E